MKGGHHRNVGVAALALLASSGTLVCCVLPAVFVSLGAGAALVGIVSAVPQLIWLSEHKAAVFGVAGLLVLGGGVLLWNARRLPCPTDPEAARTCQRLRSVSLRLYAISAFCYVIGAGFAFALPMLGQ
jgi:hypothetical protein